MDYWRWWCETIIIYFEYAMCFVQRNLMATGSCCCKSCCSWYARMEPSTNVREFFQAFYSSFFLESTRFLKSSIKVKTFNLQGDELEFQNQAFDSWSYIIHNDCWFDFLFPLFGSYYSLRFFYCVFLIHLHSPVFDLLRFVFLFKFLVVMAQLKLLANFQFKLFFPLEKVNQVLAWQAHQHLMFHHLHCQLSLSLPILMCMNVQPRNLKGRMTSLRFSKILGQPSFLGQNQSWGGFLGMASEIHDMSVVEGKEKFLSSKLNNL